jgi:hypothetical protein
MSDIEQALPDRTWLQRVIAGNHRSHIDAAVRLFECAEPDCKAAVKLLDQSTEQALAEAVAEALYRAKWGDYEPEDEPNHLEDVSEEWFDPPMVLARDMLATEPMQAIARKLDEYDDHKTRCHNYDPDGTIKHLHEQADAIAREAAVGRAVLALEGEHTAIIDWYPNDRRWRVQKFSGTGSPSVGASDTLDAAIAAALGDDESPTDPRDQNGWRDPGREQG